MDAATVGNLINFGILVATLGGLGAVAYQLGDAKKSQIEENKRRQVAASDHACRNLCISLDLAQAKKSLSARGLQKA